MEAQNNTINNLLNAAKEAAENPPSRENVLGAIEQLAKGYPGFKGVGYEPASNGFQHYVMAEYEGREPITAGDYDVCFAICLLNARLMRHFLKPQEAAA